KLRKVEYSESKVADSALDAATSAVVVAVKVVLTDFGALKVQPTGTLPFHEIAEHIHTAEAAAKELSLLLAQHEREREAAAKAEAQREREATAKVETTTSTKASLTSYRNNPIRDRHINLQGLSFELGEAREALNRADKSAGGSLMLL